ncbi:MAG: hypothetical protein HYX77_00015 [Acidobacteria bacterium]|nr:hypothetical protein [Acidobacteriota bacterium]
MEDQARRGYGFDLMLAVWARRKWLAALVFVWALAAVVSVTMFLPDIYRAKATVLVERQQVPEVFVRPSVTGELKARLETLSQEILSRSPLMNLITHLDLYPDLRQGASPESLIERMRRDIQLEFKEVDQRWGRETTIAFTLSYRGRDPQIVAQVANALASFYVEENVKLRERQASGTVEFLRAQLEEAKKRLDAEERRVAEFKMRYLGELPHQVTANLAALERLNAQLRLNSDKQIRAMERQEALVKQLTEAGGTGSPSGPDATAARIAKLNRELAELRTRFTEKYPDVIRLKAEIAALERQLTETTLEGSPKTEPAPPADFPLRRLKDALSQVEAEIKGLKDEEKALRQAIATYERRVENAPRREQEFPGLLRDYETAKELYASLLKRYEEAQLAESMEQHQKGEQFRILDPAIPPKEPQEPNRFRLILLGLMFSLGLAAGAVVLAEKLDTSFHSVDDLRAFTKVPVLVSIPRIITEADASRRRWRLGLGAAAALLGLVLIVAASYSFAQGNEQLVLMLARGRS